MKKTLLIYLISCIVSAHFIHCMDLSSNLAHGTKKHLFECYLEKALQTRFSIPICEDVINYSRKHNPNTSPALIWRTNEASIEQFVRDNHNLFLGEKFYIALCQHITRSSGFNIDIYDSIEKKWIQAVGLWVNEENNNVDVYYKLPDIFKLHQCQYAVFHVSCCEDDQFLAKQAKMIQFLKQHKIGIVLDTDDKEHCDLNLLLKEPDHYFDDTALTIEKPADPLDKKENQDKKINNPTFSGKTIIIGSIVTITLSFLIAKIYSFLHR